MIPQSLDALEQAIKVLQTKVEEIRRSAAKPHPAEDADFIAAAVAEADAIDIVIAAVPPHDWRYDELAQVYRCDKCLVRGDRPHTRTCPAAIPWLQSPVRVPCLAAASPAWRTWY